MNKITWIRPSKVELITNDLPATIEHCEKLGYKRKQVRKAKAKAVKTDGNS
jgi:hypothetical protein